MMLKTRTLSLASTGALLLAAAGGAHAVEWITNGSFEDQGAAYPGAATYCYISGTCASPLTGWTGDVAVMTKDSGAWQNPSGLANWAATAKGDVVIGVQNFSQISQSVALVAGTYTLTWTDAGRGGPHDTNSYNVFWDATQLNAVSFTTVNSQAWSDHSLTFTAIGAGVLMFQGTGPGPDGTSFIDTVSLISVVPEPEGYGLALAGFAVLLAGAKRRKAG